MHGHLESIQMNSFRNQHILTANAKTCFPYLSSFQEQAKMMAKILKHPLPKVRNLFCSDKFPSCYHHFGVFVRVLFQLFLHKEVFVGTMASSLAVPRHSFHAKTSIMEYNQNSFVLKRSN